jgi:hypothetical protein
MLMSSSAKIPEALAVEEASMLMSSSGEDSLRGYGWSGSRCCNGTGFSYPYQGQSVLVGTEEGPGMLIPGQEGDPAPSCSGMPIPTVAGAVTPLSWSGGQLMKHLNLSGVLFLRGAAFVVYVIRRVFSSVFAPCF